MTDGDKVGPLKADRYLTGSNLTGRGIKRAIKTVCARLNDQNTFLKRNKSQSKKHKTKKDELLQTGHFTIFKLRVDRQPLPSSHSAYKSTTSLSKHTDYFKSNYGHFVPKLQLFFYII